MKALRRADGSIEVDGSPEEIQRVFGIAAHTPPAAAPPKAQQPAGDRPVAKLTGPRPLGERVAGSVPDRLLAALKAQPGKSFSIAELALAAGVDTRTASTCASRLKREANAIVESPARGKYRARVQEIKEAKQQELATAT